MPASSGGWNLQPGEKDPTVKIIVGVVAVGALAIGVVLATRGGDDNSGSVKPPSTTAVQFTTTPMTTVIAPTTTAAFGTTSTLPTTALDGAALVAAMPSAAETPSGWERSQEPSAQPSEDESAAFCDQPSEIAWALANGAIAIAEGPGYTIPPGSHFGFEVSTFPTASAAVLFMQQLRDDANLCSSTPINYTMPESYLDFVSDSYGDFDWSVREASAASAGQFVGDEGIMRVTVEMRYAATVQGQSLTAQETVLIVYEQHGRSVIEYWIDGAHDLYGMSVSTEQPPWATHPTQADLDSAVSTIKQPMLTRLEAAGAF